MGDMRNLSSFADFFDADIAGAVGGGPFGGPPGIKRYGRGAAGIFAQAPGAEQAASRPSSPSMRN